MNCCGYWIIMSSKNSLYMNVITSVPSLKLLISPILPLCTDSSHELGDVGDFIFEQKELYYMHFQGLICQLCSYAAGYQQSNKRIKLLEIIFHKLSIAQQFFSRQKLFQECHELMAICENFTLKIFTKGIYLTKLCVQIFHLVQDCQL